MELALKLYKTVRYYDQFCLKTFPLLFDSFIMSNISEYIAISTEVKEIVEKVPLNKVESFVISSFDLHGT